MNNKQPVHPLPRTLEYPQAAENLSFGQIVVEGDLSDRAEAVLRQLGQRTATGEILTVRCVRTRADGLERDPITGYRHGEGYRVTAAADGKSAVLEFAEARGLRYGLTTITELLGQDAWRAGLVVEDAPRFPLRGLIEGYYGPPWPPAKRHEMLALMARNKMNTYFYGPKDDAYHRERWRELYPEAELEELRTAIAAATDLDMDFWYTIGPGLSMAYSSEEDVAALQRKLLQIAGLGIRYFGLLFDDIPEQLQHDADLKMFDTLPEAHASVANQLYRSLLAEMPDLRFAVCPTQYSGAGNEPYITELGELVDPRIEMLWTGPQICSRELSLRDAALLERTVSRPVLYWDNYPVNDCEMIHELHIGPYRGRDPHLYRASIGIVANGMEYPESSKISLITVADYLWNPEAYDPESSWDHALRTVVGETQWKAFKIFADNSRFSCLYQTDSPYLSEQLLRVRFLLGQGRQLEALEVFTKVVGRLDEACALFDEGLENRDLFNEIGRWISKFRKGVALLKGRLELDVSGTGDTKDAFAVLAGEYAADRTYVFADVLNSLVEE
jgi:hyaluronoglucosaminidase